MAGHSRSKDGVASLAHVPAIQVLAKSKKDVDACDKRGHDGEFGEGIPSGLATFLFAFLLALIDYA